MFQVGPANAVTLPNNISGTRNMRSVTACHFLLTKEVITIIKGRAICMPGKIMEKYSNMSTLKDIVIKKDDTIWHMGNDISYNGFAQAKGKLNFLLKKADSPQFFIWIIREFFI